MKLFLILLIFSTSVYSYVDMNLGYSLSQRKIDGIETPTNPTPGSAQTTSESYSLNWAWFIWEYTALE
ncbi:MAG: hypothetical protein OEW87_11920, partial [Flavobacteriaceae bacterium]|nr:hypothetical protein [Flavobacteriaceae bacterium]